LEGGGETEGARGQVIRRNHWGVRRQEQFLKHAEDKKQSLLKRSLGDVNWNLRGLILNNAKRRKNFGRSSVDNSDFCTDYEGGLNFLANCEVSSI